VDPRAGLDDVAKRNNFPRQERYPGRPARKLIALPTEPSRFEIVSEICYSQYEYGRAVAQAVSRWLPTAVARVRVGAACGICGGQSGTGAGFLRVFRFLLPIIIPPISPSS
jgi:hypothetical protein